jgi:putative endonuclease
MADHNELGKEGENVAADYLLGKSYAILERNWRFHRDELDIICRYQNKIVIVEVKTREAWQPEPAEKSVTIRKQRRMVRTAHAYMMEKELSEEVRFDVIVVIKKESWEITHFEDAFYPLA